MASQRRAGHFGHPAAFHQQIERAAIQSLGLAAQRIGLAVRDHALDQGDAQLAFVLLAHGARAYRSEPAPTGHSVAGPAPASRMRHGARSW
jgi:hypothetical protein